MDEKVVKFLKLLLVILGGISAGISFILTSSCSGMSVECQGSYCIKKS